MGGGNDNNFNIDLDRDGTNDMMVDKQEIIDTKYDEDLQQYITTYVYSIEFKGLGNDKVEFAAVDDCINFYYGENEISSDLSWESEVTVANNYAISCNNTMTDGQNFIGFRLKKDDEYHYGWMEIDYNLYTGMTLTFDGWAYHTKAGKSIWTGQTE